MNTVYPDDSDVIHERLMKKQKVEGYMKSKKTDQHTVRVSSRMTADMMSLLASSGVDSVAEFIRLAIANQLAGVTVAERVIERIGDLSDGLNYTRTKIEDAAENGNESIKNVVLSLAEEMDIRDKKFAEMMQVRDKEFSEITESMMQIVAVISQFSNQS